jgi:uncharacterized protein YodC (DUF2158 family)
MPVITRLFHVGDLVMLRSGGPIMTVSGYQNSIGAIAGNSTLAQCCWFDNNGTLQQSVFEEKTLKKMD